MNKEIRVHGRKFETQGEADQYLAGYRCYPRWPQAGLNGSRKDVTVVSIEAMGWYDAEREEEEKMHRRIK